MPDRVGFLDIDTQRDFMLPGGALYVPGADAIIPNLAVLMRLARERGIPVISTADAHPADDPSFKQWPPHCVKGTAGQLRIPETTLPLALTIPNRPGALDDRFKAAPQVIVEKVDYDAATNPNFAPLLKELMFSRLVAFGVATDYCVQATVLSTRLLGVNVDLVQDAIQGIMEEASRKALERMAAAGVRLVSTRDVIQELTSGNTAARDAASPAKG
jgi:nicotinamidase/pyrazinamidase